MPDTTEHRMSCRRVLDILSSSLTSSMALKALEILELDVFEDGLECGGSNTEDDTICPQDD